MIIVMYWFRYCSTHDCLRVRQGQFPPVSEMRTPQGTQGCGGGKDMNPQGRHQSKGCSNRGTTSSHLGDLGGHAYVGWRILVWSPLVPAARGGDGFGSSRTTQHMSVCSC